MAQHPADKVSCLLTLVQCLTGCVSQVSYIASGTLDVLYSDDV